MSLYDMVEEKKRKERTAFMELFKQQGRRKRKKKEL